MMSSADAVNFYTVQNVNAATTITATFEPDDIEFFIRHSILQTIKRKEQPTSCKQFLSPQAAFLKIK
jgi:hypothetical protein